MASLSTDVLEISFEIGGPEGGAPVMLVHGWPDAARGWSQVAKGLHQAGFRTITPDLRGSGGTRFRSESTPRDGQAVALSQDLVDLADGLGLHRFAVLGHDWGARVAYTAAALFPHRLNAIVTLALPYQPAGKFVIPDLDQAQAFWYQWFMNFDGGIEAIGKDPIGFARLQWDAWSPPGWFDDAEFHRTAQSFQNPDWLAITLNAYRSRFLSDEARDTRYDGLRAKLAQTGPLHTPTQMIQGGCDRCDLPASSEGQEGWFSGGYRRVVLDDVGHFPHREDPRTVAGLAAAHLSEHQL